MNKWTRIKFAFSEVNTILGVVSAFLTTICVIDFSELCPELSMRICIVCGIFIVAFLAAFIKTMCTRRVKVDLNDGRMAIVECGDLFSGGEVIVIPVNDSFDTIVDDIIIAKKSIHGQFVKRFFDNHVEEISSMNNA